MATQTGYYNGKILIDSNDLKYWSGETSSKADIASILIIFIRTTSPLLARILPPATEQAGGFALIILCFSLRYF